MILGARHKGEEAGRNSLETEPTLKFSDAIITSFSSSTRVPSSNYLVRTKGYSVEGAKFREKISFFFFFSFGKGLSFEKVIRGFYERQLMILSLWFFWRFYKPCYVFMRIGLQKSLHGRTGEHEREHKRLFRGFSFIYAHIIFFKGIRIL